MWRVSAPHTTISAPREQPPAATAALNEFSLGGNDHNVRLRSDPGELKEQIEQDTPGCPENTAGAVEAPKEEARQVRQTITAGFR